MWDDAVGWAIALLTIAVSAGLVSTREGRLLKRLRNEAEVLPLLPQESRDAFGRHVAARAEEYLSATSRRSFWLNPPVLVPLTLAFAGALLMWAGGAFDNGSASGSHSTAGWVVVLIGFAAAMFGYVWFLVCLTVQAVEIVKSRRRRRP